jgi:2-dehydro-3-deoxygluconokinase
MTAAVTARVLTLGETMALLDPTTDGAIAPGMKFSLRLAGAESNFAIALRRLGVTVTWVSRLGVDPLGDAVFRTLEQEDLDLSYVRRDDAPTGLFLKWRSEKKSSVLYYRNGSAASHLDPGDVPDEALEGASLVHLTGITMAIGESARRTVLDVARRAKIRGIPVMFDPNYRPALWSGPDEAAALQEEVLGFVDWYLCGLEEGNLLWGTSDETALFNALSRKGVRSVVRVGREGALVHNKSSVSAVAPDQLEQVQDEIGAGDAFAAGFAYGLLKEWQPVDCARAGNALAARALRGTGDWETLPYLAEIEDDLLPRKDPARTPHPHDREHDRIRREP